MVATATFDAPALLSFSNDEKRTADRCVVDYPARYWNLSSASGPPCFGSLLDISARGVRLRANLPLALRTAVRIDVEQWLLLGEVVYCQEQADGFECGIALCHCLQERDVRNLAKCWQDL